MDYSKDTRKRTKTTITPAQLLELGKLPPQAVDLEEAVLGALMLDKDALSNVIDIVKPEAFRLFSTAHHELPVKGDIHEQFRTYSASCRQ